VGGHRAGHHPLERDGVLDPEPAAARAAQLGQVRAAADVGTEIRDEAADVRPLAARDRDPEPRRRKREQLEPIDPDLPRRDLDVLPGAGEPVHPHAVLLDRRERGRDLRLLADAACERGAERGLVDRDGVLGEHAAGPIERVGDDAEHALGLVRLVVGEQVLRELGGRAEADRQDAGRDRIERAAVPGALGAERALHAIHRAGRGQACGLVEDEHPVHPPLLSCPLPTAS
jgi:hypothetical protein